MADNEKTRDGSNTDEIVEENGTNTKTVICQRCPCVVFRKGDAKFTTKEIFLPHMKKKSDDQKPEDGEVLQSHWFVDDMYKFENVGFSKNVGSIKYLICADCEVGPIGWHDTQDKKAFYIALDRVTHS